MAGLAGQPQKALFKTAGRLAENAQAAEVMFARDGGQLFEELEDGLVAVRDDFFQSTNGVVLER